MYESNKFKVRIEITDTASKSAVRHWKVMINFTCVSTLLTPNQNFNKIMQIHFMNVT